MNIKPKKSLGQNFLQDYNILKKIIKTANVSEKDIVLEIGPGTGYLTNFLLEKTNYLIAIEKDRNLYNILKIKFHNKNNLHLINADILEYDFKNFSNFQKPIKIISNIPYNISSQIILKVIYSLEYFEEIYLTIQKDVAQRIVSKSNSRQYGLLSAFVQTFFLCERKFDISPSCFFPKPKVFSSLLILKKKKNHPQIDKRQYFNFLKICFSMKRKKLNNNLKKYFDKNIIDKAFLELKINTNTRPENIEAERYLQLFHYFHSDP